MHDDKVDPKWANRRRLLRGRDRLSGGNFATMWNALVAEDPVWDRGARDREFTQIRSRPLVYDGELGFGDPVVETVRWRKGTSALVTAPAEGEVVAAHWDWICGRLSASDVAALEARTRQMLKVVNRTR